MLIPYYNPKDEDGQSHQPIELKAGGTSHWVSMFNLGLDVQVGEIYCMAGLHYNFFGDGGRLVLRCTRFDRISYEEINEKIKSMPLESTMLNISRDIPTLHDTIDELESWKFLCVSVSPKLKAPYEENVVYGKFSLPVNSGDSSCLEYVDRGGITHNCLSGGKEGNVNADNQLLLMVNGSVVLGRTRLFEESIDKFQVDWKKFGMKLIPHLEGYAFCTINKKGSRELICPDRCVAAVQLSTCFLPNLGKMIRGCGLNIKWETMEELDPRFKQLKRVYSSDPMTVRFNELDGINLSRCDGCLIPIKEAYDKSWLEIYVLAVTDKSFNELKFEEEKEKLDALMDKKYIIGEPEYAFFALITPTSPCSLDSIVDKCRFRYAGATRNIVVSNKNKRVKIG